MLHHLCLVTYSDPSVIDHAKQKAIDEAYLKLPSIIPGITAMRVGKDLGLLQGNAHYAIFATFESEEAFRNYSVHPAHIEIIYPALGPYMASYVTAQFDA